MSKIKRTALLADDHPAILEKVSRLLSREFEVVGVVKDGVAAVEAVVRLKPDVVVMDISMPLLNGIQAMRRFRELGVGSKIVILTANADPDFAASALELGASGYVLKFRMNTDLLPALENALIDEVFSSLNPATSVAYGA
jgi:DNA-binding NarL/FixJ family response regulator